MRPCSAPREGGGAVPVVRGGGRRRRPRPARAAARGHGRVPAARGGGHRGLKDDKMTNPHVYATAACHLCVCVCVFFFENLLFVLLVAVLCSSEHVLVIDDILMNAQYSFESGNSPIGLGASVSYIT